MNRLFLVFLLILNVFSSYAIGEWNVFPISTVFSRGEIFSGQIFLLSEGTLYSVAKEELDNIKYYNRLTGLNGTVVYDIVVSPTANRLAIVYSDGNIDFMDVDGSITNLPDYANKVVMGDRTITGVSERDGNMYITTGFGFMIVDISKAEFVDTFNFDISEYKDGTYGIHNSTVSKERLNELNSLIEVNGVGSASNNAIIYDNGFVLTSNVDDLRSGIFYSQGIVSIYDTYDDNWHNLYEKAITAQTNSKMRFLGTSCVAIDPTDSNHIMIGTYGSGLYELYGDSVVSHHDGFNTNLIDCILPDIVYTSRVGGIEFDENGYVWLTSVAVDKPLRCITPSGDFLKFPMKGYEIYTNGLDKLLLAKNDPYRFKYIMDVRRWKECQVGIYYDGGTPEDVSDDESVSFSSLEDQDGNVYTPNYFNDFAEDKNGAIWLMTSSGPFVIDSQIECFKHPGKVRRVKIPRNDGSNLADYLLGGVDCSCITIDAANRKWIGTKDAGLYLVSADGLTQIEHFTSTNSPLPSDNILAMAYDATSGTMYISCTGGLVSYVTDAVMGEDNYSNVKCFPNPVRPEFTGTFHITGLKDNTRVKICDITNNVVYSTVSEGGSVAWDLIDDSGNRVKAGVYIVYGTDMNGHGGKVTKFLVVN